MTPISYFTLSRFVMPPARHSRLCTDRLVSRRSSMRSVLRGEREMENISHWFSVNAVVIVAQYETRAGNRSWVHSGRVCAGHDTVPVQALRPSHPQGHLGVPAATLHQHVCTRRLHSGRRTRLLHHLTTQVRLYNCFSSICLLKFGGLRWIDMLKDFKSNFINESTFATSGIIWVVKSKLL